MSARKRLYDYLAKNGIGSYKTKVLRKIGQIDDWARVLRQLRQDGIIEYLTEGTVYKVNKINEFSKVSKRSGLSSKQKYKIRNRDGHLCQSCGKGAKDNVKLHVDHKIPLEWGGTNLDDNLWVLCEECNLGKKNFFKDDFDIKTMKAVYAENSGYRRLLILFQESPNKKFSPAILQGIAGIRDWTRTIRNIRTKHNLNIKWIKPSKDFPNGYYSNIQESF